jgi:CspA family cold shock protein
MKGKILNFKAEKGFGFILGEDNQKYFFHISNVSNPMDIQENYMVEFKSKKREKGLNAINVTVQAPLSQGRSKDKILKLRNLRIRASVIKEYKVVRKQREYDYLDHSNSNCWNYNTNKYGYGSREESSRWCYTLIIETYTSGTKKLEFKDCDEDKNKKDAYRMVDYIDEELNKLL